MQYEIKMREIKKKNTNNGMKKEKWKGKKKTRNVRKTYGTQSRN